MGDDNPTSTMEEEPKGNKVTTVFPDMEIDLWEAYEHNQTVKATGNYSYIKNENGSYVAQANQPEPLLTDERDDSRLNESEDFNGMAGVADPYNTSFDADNLKETAKGIVRSVPGGIMDAANGFIDMTGEMGEVLNNILPYNLGKLGYITFTPEDGLG